MHDGVVFSNLRTLALQASVYAGSMLAGIHLELLYIRAYAPSRSRM